ncbi:hydrogenase maturation protease [Pleurocapsa sp. PCC 7319]|uniref:hydrogenase maturation protease n=1 Tax=Pleurocapsa sp. PCC 7319 TaxID=118161 RepID=UPI00034C00EE|nr:hydrogenase maturation protease [Pleurocapsa sp. PCC 7319]
MNFLVIGYGNTLRSDDGAGQILARKIAQWDLPGVRSLAVHQLTPELAEIIAQADAVIFIDAIATNLENPISVQIKQLEAEDDNTSFGHTCNPRSLLSLTQILYGEVIKAYWILIPAVNFDFGEQLSFITQRGIDHAFNQVKQLIALAKA